MTPSASMRQRVHRSVDACRSNRRIMELAEIRAPVAAKTVRASVRESEPGTAMVSATKMAVPAPEMPAAEAVAAPEMTAAKVVATTVTSTMTSAAVAAAASAKCRARQYGREHNDGNYSTWSRHGTLAAPRVSLQITVN